jgi:hypothetical protein
MTMYNHGKKIIFEFNEQSGYKFEMTADQI